MGLLVLRFVFIIMAVGLGIFFINSGDLPEDPEWMFKCSFGHLLLCMLYHFLLALYILYYHSHVV